jgi:membrane peptidoglycan carboxypeptidase
VHGLGDGLWAWYNTDFATVNGLLRSAAGGSAETVSRERAMAYRQVLCLLLAQRRPAFYLGEGYGALQTLANSYLRLMATQGVIAPAWRDATLGLHAALHPPPVVADTRPFMTQKTTSVIRTRLAHDLGVANLYDLDHLDLTVSSTICRAGSSSVCPQRRS